MGAVSLLSQLVFMLAYLERDDSELAEQCAATIRYEQQPDGGWSTTPDGATNLSASVQAYFALKLTGHDPTDEFMRQARQRIRSLGGATAADVDTCYFLALFGQVSYDVCDPMPSEAFLFGRHRSLSQATKSILWSHRPVCAIEIGRGVRELFVDQPAAHPTGRSLTRRLSKLTEQRRWTPLRRRALSRIERQLLERVEHTEATDHTCQEVIDEVIALRALGYGIDSAEISRCEELLRDLVEVEETTCCAYPRFSTSAVAESALVLRSLVESGVSPLHPAVREGRDFVAGIAATVPSLSCEDNINVIAVLGDRKPQNGGVEAALPPDFDVCWDSNDSEFSDEFHADASDPASQSETDCFIAQLKTALGSGHPHLVGAAVQSFTATGDAGLQTAIKRGARELRTTQRADGSWSDSDGTSQILCTSSAIRGLLAGGSTVDEDSIAAATNWLAVEQRPDGSWNNSPTETAWAILGLVAVGQIHRPAVRRGIDYLLNEQDEAGGWMDLWSVLRNPAVNQWFRNDLHSTAWSLMALSHFAMAASSAQSPADARMSLRLVAASSDI
jgi:squalene-hopene/tetraprenyl-beta-curcumene cyclase